MNLNTGTEIAARVVELLAPGCEQIVVAGSIRRGKAQVSDIELVVQARKEVGHDLFGDTVANVCLLTHRLADAVTQGLLAFDSATKRDGPRYKRLTVPTGCGLVYSKLGHTERVPVDVFIAAPDNWGNLLAIRTGDAEFSKLLVTPRRYGGLMPANLYQEQGYLWRLFGADRSTSDTLLPCPTEEAFFAHLGLPFVAPRERTRARACQLAARPRLSTPAPALL